MAVDDLGFEVAPPPCAARVVSLVPSLTEALASAHPEALVGVTDWCTHPADLEAARIRGTKNPDLAAISALAPDLVVASKEENRRLDVDRLRAAGIPVWVTDINSLTGAFATLRRLYTEALGWTVPTWVQEAEEVWAEPAAPLGLRVGAAIWRDPWMVIGSPSFADDVLSRLGVDNAFSGRSERYPTVSLEELGGAGLDLVILPDEPYPFSAHDGPESFADLATALVSGRQLTWYGPSLVSARHDLETAIRRAHTPTR